MKIVLEIVLGIISGIFAAIGVGGSSVLIMGLTSFLGIEQRAAQGVGLIFFIPAALTAVVIYAKKRLIVAKIAVFCAISGILGAILGFFISSLLSQEVLSKIFGLFLICMGIYQFKLGKLK
jgi:uncharacterized membrane protein YfcA